MLTINTEENGSEITVILEGKVDTGTAPELSKELDPLLESHDKIILDLKDVLYVSSAGLRVFLATDQTMKNNEKTAQFKNVPGPVMDIFEMTGFSNVLDFI